MNVAEHLDEVGRRFATHNHVDDGAVVFVVVFQKQVANVHVVVGKRPFNCRRVGDNVFQLDANDFRLAGHVGIMLVSVHDGKDENDKQSGDN